MTVSDLIQELQACPSDACVWIHDFYGAIQRFGNAAPTQEVIIGRHTDNSVIVYIGPRLTPNSAVSAIRNLCEKQK